MMTLQRYSNKLVYRTFPATYRHVGTTIRGSNSFREARTKNLLCSRIAVAMTCCLHSSFLPTARMRKTQYSEISLNSSLVKLPAHSFCQRARLSALNSHLRQWVEHQKLAAIRLLQVSRLDGIKPWHTPLLRIPTQSVRLFADSYDIYSLLLRTTRRSFQSCGVYDVYAPYNPQLAMTRFSTQESWDLDIITFSVPH